MILIHLVYDISIFLAPKSLIKLSLCSKHLRAVILNDQQIWRTQYYKEWPAYFTPRNSAEDSLFPAPTWIQVFFMRKLSEFNIEKRIMKEITCKNEYRFFQDLMLHQGDEDNTVSIYKNLSEKLVEYNGIEDFNLYHSEICHGKDIIACSDNYKIYYFSLSGDYGWNDSSLNFRLFPINESSFFGSHFYNASKYTITTAHKILKHRMAFSEKSAVTDIYGKPGYCVSVEFGEVEMRAFSWCMWDLRGSKPELVMKKGFIFEHEITKISKCFLANVNFIFIPFMDGDIVYVYVYSFKEDKSRVFRITFVRFRANFSVFHISEQSNTFSFKKHSRNSELLCIFFHGDTLESLTFAFSKNEDLLVHFTRVTKWLLFILTKETRRIENLVECKLIDMRSGSVVWSKNVRHNYYKVDINSRYFICDRKMYDFSPGIYPNIKDWLYKLFE